MTMLGNILLLSIKPEYADKIFSGKKTVELRRVRTRLNPGDLVLVYVSSPKKALVGSFEVECVSQIEIENLQKDLNIFWKQIKDKAKISYREFRNYYKGASIVVGISLTNVKSFSIPVELEQLRQRIPQFQPPQSYRYLNQTELKMFESILQEDICDREQLELFKDTLVS
jgi:predicted transcriptional regulator